MYCLVAYNPQRCIKVELHLWRKKGKKRNKKLIIMMTCNKKKTVVL